MPSQATIDLEAPPQEQAQQEKHAEEAAAKATKRARATTQSDLRRQQAFVVAYTTPTAPEFLQARKAAITAGYKPKYAASVASRLMKRPRIKEMIDASLAEITAKLTSEEVTVEFVKRKHLEAMARCQLAGDRTNEREHLECVGRMLGAYDVSLHLDLTVKHEYDERLALEVQRLARIALEDMGDRVLGLLGGDVVDVHVEGVSGAPPSIAGTHQEAPESTNAAPVVGSVGGEGDRPPEASLVPLNDSSEDASGERGADHDGHLRSDNVTVCCARDGDSDAGTRVDDAGAGGLPQVVGGEGSR